MKRSMFLNLVVIMAVLTLVLAACSNSNNGTNKEPEPTKDNGSEVVETQPSTVEITDAHGTVTVPVNPKNVVAMDSRTFETLASWGIELAAAPKNVMPADSPYVSNESVKNIGNHREPNLEIIAAVEPELIIIGQRFAGFYEDVKN